MVKKKVQCAKCSERFKDTRHHNRHVRDMHNSPGIIYIYTEKDQEETKVGRNEMGRLPCSICKKQYVNRKHLQKHHKSKHNPKKAKEANTEQEMIEKA